MRLVVGVLALTLLAPLVRAEDARTAQSPATTRDVTQGKVPLRVVRVMPESRQALLFDRTRGTHVLAEVGGTIEGYTVENIDGDEVTLRRDGTQIVLAAPARPANRAQRGQKGDRALPVRPAPGVRPTDRSADPSPIDPYAEPAIRTVQAPGSEPGGAGAKPIEPGEGGVRVVRAPGGASGAAGATGAGGDDGTRTPADAGGEAASARPIVAGAGGVRVVEAPGSLVMVSATPEPMPIDAYADDAPTNRSAEASPITATGARTAEARAPESRAPESRTPESRTPDKQAVDARAMADMLAGARSPTPSGAAPQIVHLSRSEVDRALDDFARLATGFRGSFSAAGVVVDGVGDGSIFQRTGLRAGDVVTMVDGARLRSLDDAANLYARASTAKSITAQIVRAGKPVTIRVTIQ